MDRSLSYPGDGTMMNILVYARDIFLFYFFRYHFYMPHAKVGKEAHYSTMDTPRHKTHVGFIYHCYLDFPLGLYYFRFQLLISLLLDMSRICLKFDASNAAPTTFWDFSMYAVYAVSCYTTGRFDSWSQLLLKK